MVIGAVFGILFLSGITFLMGIQIFHEKSTSMEPTIEKGSLLLVKRPKNSRYKKGDIVTAYIRADQQVLNITHRITKELEDGRYITKGDANEKEDIIFPEERNICGKVIGSIPGYGDACLWIRHNGMMLLLLWLLQRYTNIPEFRREY